MVPEVNATWTGEGARVLSNIDIATAVATEGGLITPIVKNAVGLGLQEISAVIKVGHPATAQVSLLQFKLSQYDNSTSLSASTE